MNIVSPFSRAKCLLLFNSLSKTKHSPPHIQYYNLTQSPVLRKTQNNNQNNSYSPFLCPVPYSSEPVDTRIVPTQVC